jgi:hypothetical protein
LILVPNNILQKYGRNCRYVSNTPQPRVQEISASQFEMPPALPVVALEANMNTECVSFLTSDNVPDLDNYFDPFADGTWGSGTVYDSEDPTAVSVI